MRNKEIDRRTFLLLGAGVILAACERSSAKKAGNLKPQQETTTSTTISQEQAQALQAELQATNAEALAFAQNMAGQILNEYNLHKNEQSHIKHSQFGYDYVSVILPAQSTIGVAGRYELIAGMRRDKEGKPDPQQVTGIALSAYSSKTSHYPEYGDWVYTYEMHNYTGQDEMQKAWGQWEILASYKLNNGQDSIFSAGTSGSESRLDIYSLRKYDRQAQDFLNNAVKGVPVAPLTPLTRLPVI